MKVNGPVMPVVCSRPVWELRDERKKNNSWTGYMAGIISIENNLKRKPQSHRQWRASIKEMGCE